MHRLRPFIALLLIGLLGIQNGALAMHVHFPTPATGVDAMLGEHSEHMNHASQDEQASADHHGAACTAANACFPVGHAARPQPEAIRALAVAPPRATVSALPQPHPETLLRPPRLLD